MSRRRLKLLVVCLSLGRLAAGFAVGVALSRGLSPGTAAAVVLSVVCCGALLVVEHAAKGSASVVAVDRRRT